MISVLLYCYIDLNTITQANKLTRSLDKTHYIGKMKSYRCRYIRAGVHSTSVTIKARFLISLYSKIYHHQQQQQQQQRAVIVTVCIIFYM